LKPLWWTAPLTALCRVKNGKSDTINAVDDGPYAFFDRSKSNKRSDRFLFDCEALIIPGEGTEFLPRHFIGKFDLHQRAYAIHEFADSISPKFLYYYLLYKKDYWPSVAVGATVKSLRMRHFEQLPVSLTNRSEQERIVAILDQAFEGIETVRAATERSTHQANELIESYISQIFTARRDDWEHYSLAQVCNDITVGYVGPMSAEYRETGVPFLRSQNIRPFKVSLANIVFVSEQFNSMLKKSELRPGDVAIVRTGYPGTAAVVPDSLPLANCSDLVILRPSEKIDPSFIVHFFNSTFGKEMVMGKIVGSAQKHFNIGAAKQVQIPVPPRRVQTELVTKMDEFRSQSLQLQTLKVDKLAVLAALKQSLLYQAFAGNL
jgi:type I restriction enzyme S subunit